MLANCHFLAVLVGGRNLDRNIRVATWILLCHLKHACCHDLRICLLNRFVWSWMGWWSSNSLTVGIPVSIRELLEARLDIFHVAQGAIGWFKRFFFPRTSPQFIRIIFGSNCTLKFDFLFCRMDHFEFLECLHNYTHIVSVRSTMDQESSFGSPFISFDWSFARGMLHALVKLNKAAVDQTGKWSLFVLENPQPSNFSFLRSQISIQSQPDLAAFVLLQQT